ncbi:MAG: chromate transporter [Eubacteriales bacterium]|nr:chromate transporter [Eubacteriales bacterium]
MMALLKLFLIFFRIGIFGFGGGYAMLPLIYQASESYGMMDEGQFSELVALSQVTPGPIAINAATYVGYQYAGIAGAVCATIGVVMPSFLLVYLLLRFLDRYRESETLSAVLCGIRPATAGLLAAAAVLLAQESMLMHPKESFLPIVLFAAVVLLFGKFKMNPILLTLVGGVCGALFIK